MRRVLGCLVVGVVVVGCPEPEIRGPLPSRTDKQVQGEPVQAPAGDELPDAEKLLADAVVAMGGADKFAALTGYYAESQLNMGGLGLTGVAKTWWTRDGFFSETEMPGVGLMKMGGVGAKVWGEDPINGLRTLAGKEAEQAGWSATLCLAYEWKKHFKSARTAAVKDGVAEIELMSALGDKVVLRINLGSKLPVSQTFTQANPLGDMPATVTFEDFRDVEGLKIPFKQVIDASLMKAESKTTKVELNPAMAGVQFEMPGSKDAVTPGAPVEPVKAVDAKKPAGGKAAGDKKSKQP